MPLLKQNATAVEDAQKEDPPGYKEVTFGGATKFKGWCKDLSDCVGPDGFFGWHLSGAPCKKNVLKLAGQFSWESSDSVDDEFL